MRVLFDGIEWLNGPRIITVEGKKKLPNKVIIENVRSYEDAENVLYMIFNKEVKRVRSRKAVVPTENDKNMVVVDALADYDRVPLLYGRTKKDGDSNN